MKSYKFTLLLGMLLSMMLVGCFAAPEAAEPETAATDEATAEAPPESGLTGTLESSGVLSTRPPQPTATPDIITQTVEDIAEDTIIADISFLGLTGPDWINLAISLIIIVVGFIVGSFLAQLAVRYLSRYLKDEESVALLKKAGGMLRWIVTLWAVHFAVVRLLFLSPGLKQALDTAVFVIGLILIARGLWFLIDMVDAEARSRYAEAGREEEVAPALTLFVRAARIVLILILITAVLGQLGINITALAALLGLGGLAFSLAARDTIADGIAGVIILLDRPFRVGDRIEITAANTWGDVTEIGLRTTRILTRDNRLVIVPNSLISKNEIINYTYPDPNYRIETHVGVAYDTNIEEARKVMRTAVRQVPAVLPDKPVDILYNDMGDSAMVFRVRWWIETYADTRRITDKVHTALQRALDDAGIDTPFPTQSIFMHGRTQEDIGLREDL